MVSMQPLDDLHHVIRFADAMAFLGANNTHADMTRAMCRTGLRHRRAAGADCRATGKGVQGTALIPTNWKTKA